MARNSNRGQSVVEAAIALSVFAALLLAMSSLYSRKTQSFERAVLSRTPK